MPLDCDVGQLAAARDSQNASAAAQFSVLMESNLESALIRISRKTVFVLTSRILNFNETLTITQKPCVAKYGMQEYDPLLVEMCANCQLVKEMSLTLKRKQKKGHTIHQFNQ